MAMVSYLPGMPLTATRPFLRSIVLALAGLLLSSVGASAIDYVWTGNEATSEQAWWGNANNWAPVGVPGPADTATIGGPHSYQISAGSITIGGLTLLPGAELGSSADLTVTRIMNWEGGIMHGDLIIAASAVMHISGEGDRIVNPPNTTINRRFRNEGRVIVSNNGNIVGGEIVNNGTFEMQNDRALVGVQFFSPGTFRKTVGLGVTRFLYPSSFQSQGGIEVGSGVVELQRQGWSGHRFYLGSKVKGPGVLRITEPTFDPATAQPYGASVEAIVEVAGVTIEEGGVVDLAHGGVLNGRISGPGLLNWTGGKISNGLTLEPGTHLLISGEAPRTLQYGNLNAQGLVTWTGNGTLQMGSASKFISSGEFVTRGNATLFKPATGNSFPAVFENHGTFRKEGADTTTFNQVEFDNHGTLDIAGGMLLFVGGYQAPFRNLEGTISLHDEDDGGPGVLACRNPDGTRSGFSVGSGNLIGPGVVDANVSNYAGGVYPAFYRAGVLRVLGNYSQQAEGALHVTIAGPLESDVSRMEVGGGFEAGGTLTVLLPNGFVPTVGQKFTIVNRESFFLFNSLDCATANFFQNTGPDFFEVIASNRPPSWSKALLNLSTRGIAGTGDNVMIGGFIVRSPSSYKTIVIRAMGPTLAQAGISGALADPVLQLYDGSGTLIAENDNWADGEDKNYLGGLAPSNSKEAAIREDFRSGNYTAIVRGAQGATGAALVEIYDVGSTFVGRAVNLSTRGRVGVGDDVMINGFILAEQPRRLLIRAVGPSLSQLNPPVPDPLLDPSLTLHDATGAIIASNDDWETSEQKEAILNSTLAPKSAQESAFLLKLSPGTYTAVLRGVGNTSGNAVIEIYDLE